MGCIPGGICDTNFEIYQMTHETIAKIYSIECGGAVRTLSEDTDLKENSCCGVGRVHFGVDL